MHNAGHAKKGRWRRGLLVALAGLCLWAPTARAQDPLSANDFNIDAVTGPILGSNRIVGLSGAFTALATDISGAPWNPASYGSRPLYELDWFEWDVTASLFVPGVFGQDDFFNNGRGIDIDKFWFGSLGLRLQFGALGLGFVGKLQSYELSSSKDWVNITLAQWHYGAAYALFAGQLVVGLGGRTAELSIELPDATRLVHFGGNGLELGALLKLSDQPWRLGFAGRLPVDSRADPGGQIELVGGVRTVRGFVLPERVYLPWEVQLGFAWQFGARPLNRSWVDPPDPRARLVADLELENRWCQREAAQLLREDPGAPAPRCPPSAVHPTDPAWWVLEQQRRRHELEVIEASLPAEEEALERQRQVDYRALPHRYWLLSADLLVTGPTPAGIGVDGFLAQQRRASGERSTLGVRLGGETELVPELFRVRAGCYLEPRRSSTSQLRPHGTAGFEVRLFRWDLFGLLDPFELQTSFSADVATRYVDVGVGIGVWH